MHDAHAGDTDTLKGFEQLCEEPSDSTFIYIVRDATHQKQMMWFLLQTLFLFQEDKLEDTSRDPRVLLQ